MYKYLTQNSYSDTICFYFCELTWILFQKTFAICIYILFMIDKLSINNNKILPLSIGGRKRNSTKCHNAFLRNMLKWFNQETNILAYKTIRMSVLPDILCFNWLWLFLFSELFRNEPIWEIQGKSNYCPALKLITHLILQQGLHGDLRLIWISFLWVEGKK